jgi:hypothetical protein
MSVWAEFCFFQRAEFCFFSMKFEMLKRESNLRAHGYRKRLPLGYCFIFVIVRVIMVLYYALGY